MKFCPLLLNDHLTKRRETFMPQIAISELSVFEIRGYREFFFAHCVSFSTHDPSFTLDSAEDWIQNDALDLYRDLSGLSPHKGAVKTQEKLQTVSMKTLEAYRNFVVPQKFRSHPYFSVDSVENWFFDEPYDEWSGWVKEQAGLQRVGEPRGRSRASSSASMVSVPRSSSVGTTSSRSASPPLEIPDVIGSRMHASSTTNDPGDDKEDDDDDDEIVFIGRGRKGNRNEERKHRYRQAPKREPRSPSLVITSADTSSRPSKRRRQRSSSPMLEQGLGEDSEDDPEVEIVSMPPGLPQKITAKLSVDEIEDITTLPDTWTVPKGKKAYRVKLDGFQMPKAPNGKEMTMGRLIRDQNQDSWDGSSGSPKGDAKVWGLTDSKGPIMCRRTGPLQCNGLEICEHFDESVLAKVDRYEPEKGETQALWDRQLTAHEAESSSSIAIVARFYRMVKESSCPLPGCKGEGTYRYLSKTSRENKQLFVGCTAWSKEGGNRHLYYAIPLAVDEKVFRFMMDNDGRFPDSGDKQCNLAEQTLNSKCAFSLHPRNKRSHCQFSHVIKGRVVEAKMESRVCHARMTIYHPVDTTIQRAFVILEKPHNHPAFAKTKASSSDKKLISDAIQAAGVVGLTANKLNRASTTLQICDGVSLSCASGVYMDRRLVREAIQSAKKERFPRGMEWEGVQYEFETHQKALPVEERYIHSFTSSGDFRVTVTMHPGLVKYIHSVNHLQIDYTFKRVHGVFNEWAIVGFLPNLNRRVTFATLYCDRATTEAFETLFTEFFRCVHRVTGKPLKFAVFFPDEADAKLLAILVDAEIAQVLGLGQSLLVYLAVNVPAEEKPEGLPTTAVGLALLVLKLCYVHFIRNIDKLKGELSEEDRNRLKEYRELVTPEQRAEWHAFCSSLTSPGAIEWYRQKAPTNSDGSPAANAWILPAVNKHESPMPSEHWDATPDNTNLVEGAHADRNTKTGIGLTLLEAILTGKADDDITLAEINKCLEEGVLPKRFNGVAQREKQGHARKRHVAKKAAARDANLDKLEVLQAEVNAFKALADESRLRQKQANDEATRLRAVNKVAKDSKIRADIKELQRIAQREIATQRDIRLKTSVLAQSIAELKKGPLAGVQIRRHKGTTNTDAQEGGGSQSIADVHPAGLALDEQDNLVNGISEGDSPVDEDAISGNNMLLEPTNDALDPAIGVNFTFSNVVGDLPDLEFLDSNLRDGDVPMPDFPPFDPEAYIFTPYPAYSGGASANVAITGLNSASGSRNDHLWGGDAEQPGTNNVVPESLLGPFNKDLGFSHLTDGRESNDMRQDQMFSMPAQVSSFVYDFLNPFGHAPVEEPCLTGQLALPVPHSSPLQESAALVSEAVNNGGENLSVPDLTTGVVDGSDTHLHRRPQRKRKQANLGLPVVPSEYKGSSKRSKPDDRWYYGVAVAKKAVPGGSEC
ncbi:hypothetical protein BKA70DRAFT_1578636 [Coprinopsis sp. MPI-PUGE-AT-0042]|nr:hypothetical protein BKA70DRAFT_1578636 [Coprinopsis sp. MPI-PUGE-AT-0042]